MKKLIFILVLAALCLTCSCSPDGVPGGNPTAAPEVTQAPTQAPNELLQAQSVSSVGEGWTEVSKYRYDIDGDGERETIRLCTDAQRGDDGKMMWDDSHRWVLETVDASNVFTMYSGSIHNGVPYFEVYEDKDGRLCVGLTVSSGAGYEIKKFVYIKDKKAFEVENVYLENGINQLYTSLQMY